MLTQQQDEQKRKSSPVVQTGMFSTQYAVFKKSLNTSLRKKLINYQMMRVFYQEEWTPKYCHIKRPMVKVFEHMISSSCLKLRLNSTLNSNILHQIAFTKFSDLKKLILPNNQITNIEALSFIYMPKIEQIILERNRITNISPINKLLFNELKVINFRNNQFSQIDKIGRFRPGKPSLLIEFCISTEYETGNYPIRRVQSHNTWAKLENRPKTIRYFPSTNAIYHITKEIWPKQYIPQLKAIKALQKKFFYQ